MRAFARRALASSGTAFYAGHMEGSPHREATVVSRCHLWSLGLTVFVASLAAGCNVVGKGDWQRGNQPSMMYE